MLNYLTTPHKESSGISSLYLESNYFGEKTQVSDSQEKSQWNLGYSLEEYELSQPRFGQ